MIKVLKRLGNGKWEVEFNGRKYKRKMYHILMNGNVRSYVRIHGKRKYVDY